MKKRLFIVLIILLVIFGGTFGFDFFRGIMMKRYFANFQPPPVTVGAQKAVKKTWHPTLSAVGYTDAINGVDVNSRVAGQIVAIYFNSGQMVKQGVSLVQLDDSIDRQNLINDTAQLNFDKITYRRQYELYKKNAVSKNAVDEAQANLIKSEAAVGTDKLNIQYKNIKAPFSGKLGIMPINVGQYVTAGQKLVTLNQLDPLYVNFNLPEQDLPKLYVNQSVEVRFDAYKNEIFKGKINAINAEVSSDTRNIEIQSTINNPGNKLVPGLYANVTVILPQKQNVITIPQTAINYSLYGDTAYIVVEKKTKEGKKQLVADQRFLTLGPRKGNMVAVQSGVKAGEMVVTSGQIKLHPGSPVKINNSVKLDSSVHLDPSEE